MAQSPEIAEACRLARAIEGTRKADISQEWLEMPWLEKLNLLSNEIPSEDQKRLRDALPNTQILFD